MRNRNQVPHDTSPEVTTQPALASPGLFEGTDNFHLQAVSTPVNIAAAEEHFTPPVPAPFNLNVTPRSTFVKRRVAALGAAAAVALGGSAVVNNTDNINPFGGPSETELIKSEAKTNAEAKKYQESKGFLKITSQEK